MILKTDNFSIDKKTTNETLVNKIQEELKSYIKNNLRVGDKMPAHEILSQELNASIKTIHDALKILIDERILLARRGRYGTTVTKMPNEMIVEQRRETSIFAPAQDTAFTIMKKRKI